MKKAIHLILVLAYISFCLQLSAQTKGARGVALGKASSSFQDIWSIVNNQAGIAFQKQVSLGIAFEERFQMKELRTKTVAFLLPTNRVGNFGFAYTHFGDEVYSQSYINVAYARTLGKHFAMGLSFDYVQLSIESSTQTTSTNAVTAELGIMVEPLENLWFSAHSYNPFRVKIGEQEYQAELPSVFQIGILYYFSKELFLVSELEKNVDEKVRFKSGISYALFDKIVLRTGIATQPTEFTSGIGVKLRHLDVDFAFYKHTSLGYTPSFAISYQF